MTTLTLLNSEEADASLRPVPWRRMIWVTWRQHRAALAGVAAFIGGIAVFVWIFGLQLHRAFAAATRCNLASSTCADLIQNLNIMPTANHLLVGGYAPQLIPVLIGAFLGAPVIAREIETGTFRYAWTQGFGRWRWALAKLVALAVVVTVAAGAVGMLFSWYYQPYFATANQTRNLPEASLFSPGLFDLHGITFAAWTLVAFAIGALSGVLIRRVVPAIVATLAVYTGLALVTANLLRLHYLAPLHTTQVNLSGSAWIQSQWWTKGGKFAFTNFRDAPHTLILQCASQPVGKLKKPSTGSFAHCLVQHGYTQLTRYQPVSRFWQFQWIEGGWLLVLSTLLISLTVWRVRRRAI